jgi:hypothetical protein
MNVIDPGVILACYNSGKRKSIGKIGYRTESDNKGCGLFTDRKNSFTELE